MDSARIELIFENDERRQFGTDGHVLKHKKIQAKILREIA